MRAYLGDRATPCPGPSREHWVPVCQVPASLSWTDKELMNRESEMELEPGRRQANLLTRLHSWVTPRRGCLGLEAACMGGSGQWGRGLWAQVELPQQ